MTLIWLVQMDLELPDNTIQVTNNLDEVLSTTYNPVYDNITIEVPIATAPKSGIEYQRTYRTLQSTSYALYDDGWQEANGGYDFAELSNPLYCQKLDFATDQTGVTLLYDNAFGNKFRYTYDDGTFMPFVVSDVYGIDHLTGLGHYFGSGLGNPTWDDLFGASGFLEGLNTASQGGYNDWFVANIRMLEVLGKNGGGSPNMYNCPYYGGNASGLNIASSSISNSSTYHRYYNNSVASFYASNITPRIFLLTRIHYK